MANIVPNAVRNHIAAGTWNPGLLTATVKAALIDSGVTVPSAGATFYSDMSSAVVGTPQTLTSKTVGSVGVGVFDAANSTFPAVTGASVEFIMLYVDTGNPATSQIVKFIDITSLSVVPNGENIIVTWPTAGIYTT